MSEDIKTGSGETLSSAGAGANPANDLLAAAAAGTPTVQRKRIPLSVPRRKLEVAPIPGYVLYWFLQGDVLDAQNGGYEFVNRDEVKLNQHGVANDHDDSGNASLGSHVEVLGNKANEQGKPEFLVLMKIRQEWWEEDRKLLDDRNASVVNAIFSGKVIPGAENATPQDSGLAYVKHDLTNLQLQERQRAQSPNGLLNRGLPKRV